MLVSIEYNYQLFKIHFFLLACISFVSGGRGAMLLQIPMLFYMDPNKCC